MKSMKIADSLSVVSGRPATTSLEVARFFGKRHDNVIRDIQEIITQLPENFLQLNFEESAYEQETPMGIKQARMFLLYRDGFMLLVMGYAGRKAMKIKTAYIEAFNAMEARLRNPSKEQIEDNQEYTYTPAENNPRKRSVWMKVHPYTLCSPEATEGLMGMISFWAHLEDVSREVVLGRFLSAWGISSLQQLQNTEIAEARSFVWRQLFRITQEDGEPAGEQERLPLEGIIDYGCHVCGHDRTALIHGICRVCNVPTLNDLSKSGIRKALAAAWGIVNRGYTDVCL